MECQQNQRLQRWLNCHNKAKSSYDRSTCYFKSSVSESLKQLGWAINQDMAPFLVIAAVTCVRDSAEKVSLLGRRNGLRITSWHCVALRRGGINPRSGKFVIAEKPAPVACRQSFQNLKAISLPGVA